IALVNLLVNEPRRDVDEVACRGAGSLLEASAPADGGGPFRNADHAVAVPVMVRPGACPRLDGHDADPQLLAAYWTAVDRRTALHARRLGCLPVELAGGDDTNLALLTHGV